MSLVNDNSEGSYIAHLKPKPAHTARNQRADLPKQYEIYQLALLIGTFTQDPVLIKYGLLLLLSEKVELSVDNLENSSAAPSIVLVSVCPRSSPNTPCFDNASLTFYDQDLNLRTTMNFGGTGPGVYSINDVAVGKNGALYFTGDTVIRTLPVVNPVQAQHKGSSEAFVLTLSPGTYQPTFYSYLGGSGLDVGSGVAVDHAGNIFVVGLAGSKNFPTTPGAPKRNMTGTSDGFIIKISP
jgi:hypothetical protein